MQDPLTNQPTNQLNVHVQHQYLTNDVQQQPTYILLALLPVSPQKTNLNDTHVYGT
jgi:hypothetical protein